MISRCNFIYDAMFNQLHANIVQAKNVWVLLEHFIYQTKILEWLVRYIRMLANSFEIDFDAQE